MIHSQIQVISHRYDSPAVKAFVGYWALCRLPICEKNNHECIMVFVLQNRETEKKNKVKSCFILSYLKEIFVKPSSNGHLFREVVWL